QTSDPVREIRGRAVRAQCSRGCNTAVKHRFNRLVALSGAAVLVAAAALAGPPALQAGVFRPPPPAPELSLPGSHRHPLRMSDYRGKVVLLAFGFTSCTEVCPITLNTFALARRKLGPSAADVRVIYITVDPQRDVPERLARYLGSFDPTFVGGTGTQD